LVFQGSPKKYWNNVEEGRYEGKLIVGLMVQYYLGEWTTTHDLEKIKPNLVKHNTRELKKITLQLHSMVMNVNIIFIVDQ
jgi:hypothetical protein